MYIGNLTATIDTPGTVSDVYKGVVTLTESVPCSYTDPTGVKHAVDFKAFSAKGSGISQPNKIEAKLEIVPPVGQEFWSAMRPVVAELLQKAGGENTAVTFDYTLEP